MSKLNLDRDQLDSSRKLAESITVPVLRYVDHHSTVSIERSVLRLFGVEGDLKGLPLVNHVVDRLDPRKLSRGVAGWFCRALIDHPRLKPSELALAVAKGEISFDFPSELPFERIERLGKDLVAKAWARIDQASQERKRLKNRYRRTAEGPLKYLIVATGNIHDDVIQAKAAAEMGADIIAVIRSTAQSLLDFVPEGLTTEGFGGTYATQKNFELMRKALDESAQELKRYVALTNYSSGLCMPEIAVMGAFEGLDYLLNDSMYGILFRDINMKRTFTDQHFSRIICAKAEITIMTGEDNYLTTAESHREWHQVLASQLINEAFAKRAGLPDYQVALGHAFEMDPAIEDSILMEIAQAQLVREFFPFSPIKFMPPTRHKSGDVFFANLYDGLFNLTGAMTGQTIQLLGMATEAIHNPFLMDRYASLKNANYIFRGAHDLYRELSFLPNGKIVRRARQVLENAIKLLKRVQGLGLMGAIEHGLFAHMPREREGGKGLDGVFQKEGYYNPFLPSQAGSYEEAPASFGRPARPSPRRDEGRHEERRGGERGREEGRGGGDREQGRRRSRSRGRRRGRRRPEGAAEESSAPVKEGSDEQ